MKEKKRFRLSPEENSSWQTMSDMMMALLLVILLIVVILILYIVRIPDEDLVDDTWGGKQYGEYDHRGDNDPTELPTVHWEPEREQNSGGGGGGGGETQPTQPTEPTEPTEHYESLYPEGDGVEKAAIYVMVVDAETNRTIKEEGIEFELRNHRNVLQTLHSYYPQKTAYKIYETTERGVFFLPEKVSMGSYQLKELTEPWGYDAADPVEFTVDTAYDWSEPLTIEVALFPSRNIIRVQMNDLDTGAGVGGGIYDVIAAEAIVTADGTLRHSEGEVVDQLVLDASGYGQSRELFLGRYTLVQTGIPEFYAGDAEPLTVSVEKKIGQTLPEVHTMTCQKTALIVNVRDELYPNLAVPDAAFVLSGGAGVPRTVEAGSFGNMTITDLAKDTRYVLRQETADKGYAAGEPLEFYVDATGRIAEEIRHLETVYDRILRITVSIRGKLFTGHIPDYNAALYDASGELAKVWSSSGVAEQIDGLAAGSYRLLVNGREQESISVDIEDVAQVQAFYYSVWTVEDILIVAVAGILAAAGLGAAVVILIRRKKSA